MSGSQSYDDLEWAVLEAEELVQELGVNSLPVDPKAIAERYGIVVEAKPATAKGISGMLIHHGDEFLIAYATHIESEGFQRFSIAHELGHYFLPGHVDAVLGDGGVHQSHAGFVSDDRYEREADAFAAGLLMPRRPFKEAMRRAGGGFEAIERLAEICCTSLTATAINYAKCSDDFMAMVISKGGKIDYCWMSRPLQEAHGLTWIRKGRRVPRHTPTAQFNRERNRVRRADREEGHSSLQDWFDGPHDVQIAEDVVGLGRTGKTLTILHSIDLPDEEKIEEEEALIESWTPRFR